MEIGTKYIQAHSSLRRKATRYNNILKLIVAIWLCMSSLWHHVTGMKVTYIAYITLRPKRFIPASDSNKHIDDQTNFICALITPQTNAIVSIYILPYMCGWNFNKIHLFCQGCRQCRRYFIYLITNYSLQIHLNYQTLDIFDIRGEMQHLIISVLP